MIIKKAIELNNIVKAIAISAGADRRNAIRLAEALVLSNLSGVDTHGIFNLGFYIDCIRSGDIAPTKWPEIIRETSNTALVKGNYTFGHTTAKFATEIAIKKAIKYNIAIVSGVQVNHTGRIGEYAEMTVEKKLISFVFTGGCSDEAPEVMPYGGKEKILHTNPFAMGFPAGKEPPMISDYATTAVSGSKILYAKNKKQDLPLGSILDKKGRPTSNPEDFFNGGGQLPFGGYKGYALMLANEFLGRIFTNIGSFADKRVNFRKCGFTIIVFKPDIFCLYNDYAKEMDITLKKIRAVPPAPGFKKVLIPGDIERENRKVRMEKGIPIEKYIWKSLKKTAMSVGLNKFD